MMILPTEEAQPGMKLVMTVMHPEHPDQDLLKPGYILDGPVLNKLRVLGVPFLYIDYPDLAELDRQLLPYLSPARQVVYSQIKRTIAAIQKTDRPTVTFPDYYVATRELILTLMQAGEHPIYMDILSGGLGADAVSHATSVAHLAVTLGIRLELYLIQQRSRLPPRHAREVVNLGVAGMLHDIGKSKLPAHLQQHDGVHPPEDPADRAQWETHPAIGGDMLRHGIEPSGVAAVVQHHQHFDGSGFPKMRRINHDPETLGGDRIHVFARILQVADLYERLAVPPGAQRRRLSIEILHLMQNQYKQWLDPRIVSILPGIIPPFPPGSRLVLSDGSSAVVTAIDPAHPYRPTVRRIGKHDLKTIGDPIPLHIDPSLSIRTLAGIPVGDLVTAALATPAS